MCEGSVYVAHRHATEKEELVLKNIPDHGMRGFYPVRGSKLVCTLPGQKAIMDEVHFIIGAYAYNKGINSRAVAATWEGQKNVEVTLTAYRSRSGDAVEMPDGSIFSLGFFKVGTRIGIGRPVRDLDKVLGMDQVRADVPVDMDAQTAEQKAEYDDYVREFARDDIAEKS